MNEFFDTLPEPGRAAPREVAHRYAHTLHPYRERLLSGKAAAGPYYVGLSSELASFPHVTERIVLVSETSLQPGASPTRRGR